jgi:hypothetical protein
MRIKPAARTVTTIALCLSRLIYKCLVKDTAPTRILNIPQLPRLPSLRIEKQVFRRLRREVEAKDSKGDEMSLRNRRLAMSSPRLYAAFTWMAYRQAAF